MSRIHTDFTSYMSRIDTYLNQLCGLVSDDLPDCMFHDWYNDGVQPREAAYQCLVDAGYSSLLEESL